MIMSLTKCIATRLVSSLRHQTIVSISTSARRLAGDGNAVAAAAEIDTQNPPVPEHIATIVQQIAQLKFYEVTLLNETLKRELKIPDTSFAPAVAATTNPEEVETAAAVKSSFTVKLTKYEESKKVALIKEIKKLVEGINLVEAKRFVEDCPKVIKANLTKEDAEALQKQLEAAGGVVKLE